MQPLSSQEQRRLLEETYTATLCTTNPNGTINAIPIWYRHDGEAFWVVTDAQGRKTRNLRRDARVSLSLLITKTETTRTVIGLVYGTATIHQLPLDELQARLEALGEADAGHGSEGLVEQQSAGAAPALRLADG